MRAVKSKNTVPEMMVRRIVSGLGYRYRLHRSDLPGKPDLAFIGRRKAVFVHGCFWHGHDCVRGSRVPKANADYWRTKITQNSARDDSNIAELEAEGWRVLVIWECELKESAQMRRLLSEFLR